MSAEHAAAPASQIDEMMEHASHALADTRYFEAASLAWRALLRARQTVDFERMRRITLPLQEARRQIRQRAVDSAEHATLICHPDDAPARVKPGLYLLQPPLIGADARALRMAAEKTKTPAVVLAREPLTRSGLWPIVSVARCSVRTRITPPVDVEEDARSPTRDDYRGVPPVGREWFEWAAEQLGDAAIESSKQAAHPYWRIDDALERLEAVPDHEKLHQFIAEQCRLATASDPPEEGRQTESPDGVF